MYTIQLNDGTVFSCRWCGVSNDKTLTMDISSDKSFAEIAALFTEPRNTARIVFTYGQSQDVFEQYTHLVLINGANAGEYLISFREEAAQ